MAELKPFERIIRFDPLPDGTGLKASLAEEIVRCKDCMYAREPNRHDPAEKIAYQGVLICYIGYDHVHPSSLDGLIFTNENDFCSEGRRESQQTSTEVI